MQSQVKIVPRSIKRKIQILAMQIAQDVPFQLWDECIEYLTSLLSNDIDKKSPGPVSVMFMAEIKHKITLIESQSRYKAIVQD